MSFLVCTYGEIACSRPCLTECWILEKVLKFAQQFSRHGKSLENGDKVWKNGKKSWVFSKLRQLLYNLFWFWSNLNRSRPYVWKKALFMRFLWSLLITYLINSSVEKESIVLEKSLEKVLNFGSTTFSTLLYILIVHMKFHKFTL